ncbi:MAG TPA: hypothetical protein VE978_14785 [Chitinophagales bacterium]|nr:hypothetical protein [Chitinophagales bacterium]
MNFGGKDFDAVAEKERDIIRNTPVSLEENFRIFNALIELAHTLGALPIKDPMEGANEKIEFVKRLHAVSRGSR